MVNRDSGREWERHRDKTSLPARAELVPIYAFSPDPPRLTIAINFDSTNDGKNTANLQNRKDKTIATTVAIKTIATNDIFKEIATSVIIELHETTTLSALLTNAESWTLNKSEIIELERIEIQCIKMLFDLPSHTPTPALIFSFGLLYTGLRVEKGLPSVFRPAEHN